MAKSEKKKICFVITPIGNPDDPIRRHIDGVIEAAVIPAFEDKYEVRVAHKMMKTGSITKQVIEEIYKDDLVVVNLTDKNPNVMYELAFRHSVGKPAIVIALEGTVLPFDIKDDRTLFYKNDMLGTLELQKQLSEIEKGIDFDDSKQSGMIYDYLRQIGIEDRILDSKPHTEENDENPWSYVLQRLDRIESRISGYEHFSDTSKKDTDSVYLIHILFPTKIDGTKQIEFKALLEKELGRYGCEPIDFSYSEDTKTLTFAIQLKHEVEQELVRRVILYSANQLALSITDFIVI